MKHLYAVVMAGGRGERFWPMGRKARPKQLLPLLGEETMIESTVARLRGLVPPEQILVITNCDYVAPIRALLPIPSENVVGEPMGRDTAPCVALAAALIRRRDSSPDATMILLSSDHDIVPEAELQKILRMAATRKEELVVIGIPPSEPSTGFGYIELGDSIDGGNPFRRVRKFREKPDLETAKQFLAAGNFRWNSGMFVWRVDTIVEAFRRFAPDLTELISYLTEPGADFDGRLTERFGTCRKISIDYAVLEKATNILALEATFQWDDVGSWNSVADRIVPDETGNARRGNTELIDCRNCTVLGESDHLIGVIGVENLVIVKAGNATLVCPRDRVQEVRKLAEAIRNRPDGEKYL